jgi:phenylalanyl-tRNA synthetase alpha chain
VQVAVPTSNLANANTPPPHFPSPLCGPPQSVHERGGFGSIGYGYNWKRSESEKNLLRTHTTAVSSRMLYQLAQEGFKPAKYFSIDRVFRNEAVDRTHLAEFHQVEGERLTWGADMGQ